jgi:hypothetical protein
VKDETALLKALKKLEDHGIRHTIFREADLDDQATAIATEPVYGEVRRLFRNYQLLQPQEACVA